VARIGILADITITMRRWGAFYSNRLVEDVLGLDPVDGIIRVRQSETFVLEQLLTILFSMQVSMLHYNTVREIEEFVKVFDGVVFG